LFLPGLGHHGNAEIQLDVSALLSFSFSVIEQYILGLRESKTGPNDYIVFSSLPQARFHPFATTSHSDQLIVQENANGIPDICDIAESEGAYESGRPVPGVPDVPKEPWEGSSSDESEPASADSDED
jgi:hypothetical protein